MNIKITRSNSKSNEERLYKLFCNIIDKDVEKKQLREKGGIYEKEKYSFNEG